MLSRRARVVVAALFALSLILTATAAIGAPIVVKACRVSGNWKWCPNEVHLVTPKRVKWKNPTSTVHTVKFYKGPWSGKRFVLQSGDAETRTVRRAGKYKYRCDIPGHSRMVDGRCRGMCGKMIAH